MGADGGRWSVRVTGEVRQWLRDLRRNDPASYESVRVAVDKLAEVGPERLEVEPELGRIDGTTAHGLERLMAAVVRSSGYAVRWDL